MIDKALQLLLLAATGLVVAAGYFVMFIAFVIVRDICRKLARGRDKC